MKKILVMTGGSRGIGRATIETFLAAEFEIINLSRTPCHIKNVTNMAVDLSQPDWEHACGIKLKEYCQHAGQICLVHNASFFHRDNIETLTPASLRSVMELSLVSALTLNQLLLPLMSAGSSIIYIGSTLSEIAVANRASYTISKHALVGMMRATCQDLIGRDITTCCICPGFVDTTMVTANIEKEILDQVIKQKVSAGRLIDATEIARFIYFCAHNPIINGSLLHANLGQINS